MESESDIMQSEVVSYNPIRDNMQNARQMQPNVINEAIDIDPGRWVDEHGDCLFRFALLRLRDETLAEDMVQEALLSAIQSLKSYGGRCAERTWLTGILKHKIIDHYRKNSKQVQIGDEETDLSSLDHFFERPDEFDGHWAIPLRPVDPEQSPDQVFERREFWRIMEKCLSAMPGRIANIFVLREIDGLTSDEICDVLQLSANNFWVIMHRARMQLRRCIEIKWFRKCI